MKSMLGEYGRMILLMTAAAVIFLFFFGNGSSGLKAQLADIKPQETLKAVSQSEKLESFQGREKLTVTVRQEKLKVGSCYDLLSFCSAEGEDQEKMKSVKITKIMNPKGEDLLSGEQPQEPDRFIPAEKGMYEISYRIPQWYAGGYYVQTTKTYRYLAA